MVNNKYKLLILSLGLIGMSLAASTSVVQANVQPVAKLQPIVKAQPTASAPIGQIKTASAPIPAVIKAEPVMIKSAMIDKVDQDADNMNALKRRLELEKIRSDIKKAKTDGDKLANISGDTTVTSVYIDQTDPKHGKYATLQFVDGSDFDVEIGANVGAYTVSDITMAGVTLTMPNCHKSNCKRMIKIGRLYAKSKNKDADKGGKDDQYMQTPVVNLHDDDIKLNNGSKDQMVPPIVTKG